MNAYDWLRDSFGDVADRVATLGLDAATAAEIADAKAEGVMLDAADVRAVLEDLQAIDAEGGPR